VNRAALVAQLRDLGVGVGDILLVHTSYRAIRPIDGGPDGVIDALIEAVADGTIVMPSWTDEDDEVFEPEATEVDDHLGVVADEFWRRADVLRGTHPFAVAAWGRHAQEIASAPFVLPPHAPDSGVACVHDLDGKVLLLGVDHDANTTIHLGELIFGVPYSQPKHITVLANGRPKRIDYDENDHCCLRFNLVGDWLRARGLQREGPFGQARATLVRSRDVVSTVVEELARDALRFLHPRGECEECDRTWRSVRVHDRSMLES
jgi:aminoglycoside N3'-acetyltransferase